MARRPDDTQTKGSKTPTREEFAEMLDEAFGSHSLSERIERLVHQLQDVLSEDEILRVQTNIWAALDRKVVKEQFSDVKFPDPHREAWLESERRRIKHENSVRLLAVFNNLIVPNLKKVDPADQTEFFYAAAKAVGIESIFLKNDHSLKLLPLPAAAPALWLDRDKKKGLTPAAFIMVHYKKWLGRGLTQAVVKDLDKSLYLAFHKWLGTEELPVGFYLPSKEEWYDRLYREPQLFNQLSTREKGLVLHAIGNRLLRERPKSTK